MKLITEKHLGLADFKAIVCDEQMISIDSSVLGKVSKNHDFLKGFASNKIIYGINTGFGPMA